MSPPPEPNANLLDGLQQSLRSAPELSTAPGLAVPAASSPDPAGTAETVAQQTNALALQRAGQRVAHHRSLWGSITHGIDVGVSDVSSVANKGLQVAQHEYRYLHDVEARHGAFALMGELALMAGTAAVGVAAAIPSGGTSLAITGGVLGAEAGAFAAGQVMHQDSWQRTQNGNLYRDPHSGQPVSLGRDFASGVLGAKPGSSTYQWASGLTDGLGDLAMDPLARVGTAAALARRASLTVQTGEDVYKLAGRSPGVQRAFDDMARSDAGTIMRNYPRLVTEQLPEVDPETGKVIGYKPSDALAQQLGNATTRGEVTDIFAQAIEAKNLTYNRLPTMVPTFTALKRGGRDVFADTRLMRSQQRLPMEWDQATRELTNSSSDPMSPQFAKNVYQWLRGNGQAEATARTVANNIINTNDLQARLEIWKNSVQSALVAQAERHGTPIVAADVLRDPENQRLLGQEINHLVDGIGPGRETVYGYGPPGQVHIPGNVLEDGASQNSAILASQTGRVSFPSMTEMRMAASRIAGAQESIGAVRGLVGGKAQRAMSLAKLDEWTAHYVTQNLFKTWVLLNATFPLHVVLSEGVLNSLRMGTYNLLKSKLAITADRLGQKYGVADDAINEALASADQQRSIGSFVYDVLGKRVQDGPRAEFAHKQALYNTDFGSTPAGLTATHKIMTSSEEKYTSILNNGIHQQQRSRFTQDFGGLGAESRDQPRAWRVWLGQITKDRASATAARAYRDALKSTTKVVDEKGDPLRVYHGTPRSFDQFAATPPESRMGVTGGVLGRGYFFTSDPGRANFFTHGAGAADDAPNIRMAYLDMRNPVTFEGSRFTQADVDRWRSQGYDGVIFKEGQSPTYAVFDRSQIHTTPDALRAGLSPDDAHKAGAPAAKAWLDQQPREFIGQYHNAFLPTRGWEEMNPMDAWAQKIMLNVRGATTGIDGSVHHDLLDAIVDGHFNHPRGGQPLLPDKINTDYLKAKEMKPTLTHARLKEPDPGGVISRIADAGYNKIVSPIINKWSREPIYNETAFRFYKEYEPLIADGRMSEVEAFTKANLRAMNDMVRFVHNVHERTQLSETIRNVAPFWFAQQQAYKRVGRLLIENPGAFRKYQLIVSNMHAYAIQAKDQGGNPVIAYPGSGFLGAGVPELLSKVGLNVNATAPVSFAGSLDSFTFIMPGAAGIPGTGGTPVMDFGPLVTIPVKEIAAMFPELTPAATHVVGDIPMSENTWKQLIPSQTAIRVIDGLTANSRSFNTSVMNVMQTLAYEQNQAEDKWIAGGRKGPEPQIIPPADAPSWTRQHFVNRIKNTVRIDYMLKAIIGFGAPLSPQLEVNDFGLKKEFSNMVSTMGLQAAKDAFLKAHPDATPFTVAESTNQSGFDLPASVEAENWINNHQGFINQYGPAAFWFMPQLSDTKYNPSVYNEQLAQGYRVKRSPQAFLEAMYVAAGDLQYYGHDLPAYQAAVKSGQYDTTTLRSSWTQYVDTFGKQNPLWWDAFQSKTRADQRQETLGNLQTIFQNGHAPTGPMADGIRTLLGSWNDYQNAVAQGVDTKVNLADSFQAYLISVADQHPEMKPFIVSVLGPLTSVSGASFNQAAQAANLVAAG